MKRPPTPLPVHEFTIGHVRVSVHCRTPEKPTPDARITFERRHDTKRDEWYPAASFVLADLDALVQALSEVRHNPFGDDQPQPRAPQRAAEPKRAMPTAMNGTATRHADGAASDGAGSKPAGDDRPTQAVTAGPIDITTVIAQSVPCQNDSHTGEPKLQESSPARPPAAPKSGKSQAPSKTSKPGIKLAKTMAGRAMRQGRAR